MSLFKEFVEGVTSGFVSAASESPSDRDVVETCCQGLGWSVDERPSSNDVRLHFNDPLIGIRKVRILGGNQDGAVTFSVHSAVDLSSQDVPVVVLAHLLQRNCEAFVRWQMRVCSDGKVIFALCYSVLAPGLNPSAFKTVCETMVHEAHEFDAKMAKAGLLRQ